METKKIVVAVIGCMTGVVFSSCQSKEQKVENAKEDVVDANRDLIEAKREFKK